MTADEKWHVEKEAVFHEQYNHLGRMNDTLFRMPAFFATVVGGLWFFAAQYLEKYRPISVGVFLFAAGCASAFALALKRYQAVLSGACQKHR